ncbi:MAG: DnaJ domain-containing protein [Bacteroidia bacterium]
MTTDFYHILGLDRSASADAIKQAYRRLAQQYHPDKNPHNKNAEEKFLHIQQAYHTLIDAEKRRVYDAQSGGGFYFVAPENLHHYFHVTCNTRSVKVNQEFEVTYSYTGEGRYFVRPTFNNFFVSSKPIVTSRFVNIDGMQVKETNLIYTLAPLHKGDFIINKAKIRLHQKPYETPELAIHVTDNECYFLKDKAADGKPCILQLNYEEVVTGQFFKTLRIQRHDVLIPRSKNAQWFHGLGTAVKYTFMIWIIILSMKAGYGFLMGLLGGGLIGSANCQLFYWLVGVKSKFYFATQHPAVREYFEQGYYLKNTFYNGSSFSKTIYFIESIFK